MLRHCTIQEILDVRDGRGTVAARRHVDECDPCRHELERTHQRIAALRALPSLRPPRDRWSNVRAFVEAERRQARWIKSGWLALAAAAVAVLMVGTDGVFQGAATADNTEAAELQTLVRQAEELDQALGTVRNRMRAVNGLTALAIADLEDQIALLDSRIDMARQMSLSQRQMTNLWRERVVLTDALVNTHVRQVSSVGF